METRICDPSIRGSIVKLEALGITKKNPQLLLTGLLQVAILSEKNPTSQTKRKTMTNNNSTKTPKNMCYVFCLKETNQRKQKFKKYEQTR